MAKNTTLTELSDDDLVAALLALGFSSLGGVHLRPGRTARS